MIRLWTSPSAGRRTARTSYSPPPGMATWRSTRCQRLGRTCTAAPTGRARGKRRERPAQVSVLDLEFSSLERVTVLPRDDIWPAWSPDGTRVAFVSNPDFNNEIYIANADGTGQTRFTRDDNPDMAPAWSPDGSRVAFAKYEDRRRDIFVQNADGSGLVRLTNDVNPAA